MAFVGIKVSSGEIYGDWTQLTKTRDMITQIDGVQHVYGVFGRFDLIAVIDTATLEDVNRVITEDIRAIQTVQSTETFIVSF
jgi:DNA-binding Lrp family transcriptional regulator